jgi:DNA-binding MarR family transcriptional regulator
MQQLTDKTSAARLALARLVAAHAELTRELSARLVEEHGLTLAEYEVLLLLSHAPPEGMRRIDLANEIRLSPSGITRMLDRMGTTGLVRKGSCASDARVTYALLTPAGRSKLRECSGDHLEAVERLLGERLEPNELAQLAELLDRLSTLDTEECEPGSG